MNQFVSALVNKHQATNKTSNRFVSNVIDKAHDNNWGFVETKGDTVYVVINGLKGRDDFAEKLLNSTKELLKKKFYLLSKENVYSATPQGLLPQALVEDLIRAKKAGLKKAYELRTTQQGDEWYISLVPVKPKFFGGGEPPKKERKLGDEQIAYIDINGKSRVGVITPAKTKRG